MVSAFNKTTGKATERSKNSTTSNADVNTTSYVPKTESMIIDEVVPKELDIPGPTTIEYDLEGMPPPEIPSVAETSSSQIAGPEGMVPPGTELPNAGPVPVPVVYEGELSYEQPDTDDHHHGFSPTTSTHDHHNRTTRITSSSTHASQPSSMHDTTTTTGKVKETFDPSSRNYDHSTTESGFDNHEKLGASNQPGYSTRESQPGYSSGPTGTTTTTSASAHPIRNDAVSDNNTTTKHSTFHRRHSSSSSKKSGEEDEGIVDKIMSKLHIGGSNKEKSTKSGSPTTASHMSSMAESPESKRHHRDLGVDSDAGAAGAAAAGAAAAYSKHETSSGYNNPNYSANAGATRSGVQDHMAATGSTEPASTHIPGRDTNTRFADFADTTSPHVKKQSDTLASDRYRTAEATGMAGTGLHNTNADVTTTDRSLGNTGNTGIYSADKYKQNASGQPGYSAGTTHQKYNEPTSKYDTSTVTGKIKDKLDPNSRDLNTSGSYNDPTSKHDTSTLTGKIMDKLDPETGGVEPSGYAIDDSKQPLAGSVGDEPSGYGLKSSNKPSDVPYSTTAEPSGYGLDPSNVDPKFSTATSAEPSGYGLEESKKHHLGTTTAAGVGAGVGAGAYAASHDSSRSHEYNDPTSKYDTSTVTGKMKDKLDPHSRDLNTSGNYNDPTSKYDTSTTTGKMKDKLDPHSRDLNASGNYNDPTSKYGTSTTTGKYDTSTTTGKYDTSTIDTGNMTEKVNPYSRDLNTSGNYNNPTSKYDTSTTTGKMKDKLDPHSRDLNTSGNYNDPTSKHDTSTTTGKMKDKLDPHSRDLNISGNYGTSLGTTAGAGATHISTGTSGLGASNPAGNDSHLTKDTSSRSAFDNRQYGRDNEYSDTIPGSYPEKPYSSGTSTHVTDSPHLGKTNTTGFGGILDESIDYEDNTAPYDASYYGSGFTGHADTTRPDTKYDASRELGSGFTSGHVAGNSASKHDSHYNNPASKYDTSRYTGRVADKVDPTSRNRGATYDSQDTKHLNDPNSKYDTSKLTGRVADKLDPSSRKTEMTGSEDYSSSPDKAGSYDFREGKRFGEISPTLKYSDRSDKIQPSILDSNHPTGAGLNASNADSSTLPTTRGEEFLSEKEKKIVQEHFSNVNQNLKPGMPEVAGVAVFPLTHEQVQHATPRSQNAVTSEEGTDATTDKQKTSKKDYSLRT